MCPTLPPGPLDELEWPSKLTAHVVAPSRPARIHGLDVQGDLAVHYSFAEVVLTTLTGQPPDEHSGILVDVCLTFLSPAPIWEAPSNAASLARRSGAPPAGVVATGAVALSEQARFEVERHAALLRSLDDGATTFPPAFQADDEEQREQVSRLRAAIAARGAQMRWPAGDPTCAAALFAVLHAAGVRTPQQLVTLLMIAKLPCLTAEAFAGPVGRVVDYPLTTPPYRYVEDDPDDG